MSTAVVNLDAMQSICDRLAERTAVLFLGAGINAGVRNGAGDTFPLGADLALQISHDLLESDRSSITLREAAEMARYRVGEAELNRYLHNKLTSFEPGTAHLSLVQLPWDVIYTTNYDLLIERAADVPSIEPAGSIRPVFSMRTNLDDFTEEDILYYKLHGCIQFANTDDGRLILTRADFEDYRRMRRPLFRRLERDLQRRTFVFVGYSLGDDNFQEILEGCRQELGTSTLPLSFAIRQNFDAAEEAYWRERYNIQLLHGDAETFLTDLKDTWLSENRSVVPFAERWSREYLLVDSSTRFPKVAESYYRVQPADCTGRADPKRFFRGGELSWADVREGVAPERDDYWSLFGAIFDELDDPSLPPSVYLVTGPAGTGKTTLIRTFAYYLAKEFELPVLIHVPRTPLEARHIATLVDERHLRRLIVVIHNAAEYIPQIERLLEEAGQRKLPLSLILEERRNQWTMASEVSRRRLLPTEIELGSLSGGEVDSILAALARHDALGKLKGTTQAYQITHFEQLAHKELLVALRELTTETSFDDIIRDEYRNIPSTVAQRAYAYVSALGQFGLPVRYETLMHLLQVSYDRLRQEVFQPTERVLVSAEETGRSRHNAGYRISVRHPVIASVIFDLVAPTDDSKLEIFNALLSRVDPGQQEDLRLLQDVARRRQIVDTIADPEKRRSIYDLLEAILPNDPYVLQHRSSLEKDLGDADRAVEYARRANRIRPNQHTIENTLGLALVFQTRQLADPMRRNQALAEADSLFEKGLARDQSDPYAYLGKYLVAREEIRREGDPDRAKRLKTIALSLLEEAHEATNGDAIIAQQLAEATSELGSREDAIAIASEALKTSPQDTRLRDLLVRYESERGNIPEALGIAMEGTRYDPTSWRLARHIARLSQLSGGSIDSVKGHYEAAIRYHQGDLSLLVELGAYLFQHQRYDDAAAVFEQAKNLRVGAEERKRIRQRWKNGQGKSQLFDGQVVELGGASGWVMATPANFRARFYRNVPRLSDLRIGDKVRFLVGFNAYGAEAIIEELPFAAERRRATD